MVNSLLPYNSVISRFGGEEFCVLMLGVSKDRAFDLLKNCVKKLKAKDHIAGAYRRHGIDRCCIFRAGCSGPEEFIRRPTKPCMKQSKGKERGMFYLAVLFLLAIYFFFWVKNSSPKFWENDQKKLTI